MAHFARGACWTSQDDMIINGYRRVIKPVISEQEQPSKPSGYYLLRDRRENAKNGYAVMCDMMMGLWRDGLDYMRVAELACQWLAKFNERSGSVFNA